MSLAVCWCWRKRSSDSDLTGVNGLVITKDPEENVNNLQTTAPTVSGGTINEINESKKEILLTNPRRSLPDIPFEHNKVDWEPAVDNSSGHYATVEQYENSMKRISLQNSIEARISPSQHSSVKKVNSSPYESVKYDKINLREHPYAQLQPSHSRNQAHEDRNISEEPGPSQRPESSCSSNERNLEIPAASAVAGGIAANSELPYMTPPIPQTNFSGDSQDSSKGYTSISVREPIANIVQTVDISKKRELDPHYSTVSDDSDDVYTTIPDACDGSTSESEIYRRIPPGPIIVEAEVNQCSSRSTNDGNNEVIHETTSHPLPLDSLKQAAHSQPETHSRQASSSSSNVNFGSPKPERRQANSPLPPPPLLSDGNLSTLRDIDDLYAKVQKNKPRSSFDEKKSVNNQSDVSHPSEFPFGNNGSLVETIGEHNYEILRKSNPNAELEKMNQEEPSYASIKGPDSICSSDPGYEVLRENLQQNVIYEQMTTDEGRDINCVDNKNDKNKSDFESDSVSQYGIRGSTLYDIENDPGYEAIGNNSDHYENLEFTEISSGEKINKSIPGNIKVPGYEQILCKCLKNTETRESVENTLNTNTEKVKSENSTGNSDSFECVKVEQLNDNGKATCRCGNTNNDNSVTIVDSFDILDEDVIFEV